MLTASNIVLMLLTLFNLFLGILVLKKSPKNSINISYFLFAFGISAWTITNAIFQITNNYLISYIICILAYYAGALIALPFFYFTLVFPAGFSNLKKHHKWLVVMWAILWFIIISFPDITLKGVALDGPVKSLITGPGLIFHFVSIAILMFAGITNLLIKYTKVKGFLKWQIRYVLIGVFTMTIFGILFNLILPILNNYSFVWLGPIFSSFVLITTAYAIVRYHLMDIYFIIRLGTIYTILFAFVAVIYTFLCDFIDQYMAGPWEHILSSIIITFTFVPLKNFIETITDKIFFKKHYKLNEVINSIETGIHSAGLNLDNALNKINEIITNSLKTKKAVILLLIPKNNFISRQAIGNGSSDIKLSKNSPIINYLKMNEGRILDKGEFIRNIHQDNLPETMQKEIIEELDRLDFPLVAPIESKGVITGVYLLGPKLSEDPFTKEDIGLIKHVAWMMGFFIENARSFEELQKADKVKSEFISVASHQLRTPISIILWNLEIYLDGKMSAKEKNKTVEAAYIGATSLQHQLDQLLVALEIEEQKLSLKSKKIDLDPIIKNVIRGQEKNIKDKKIKLTQNISGTLPEINGDDTKIKKSLEAILSNAITYTPPGGEITISSSNKEIRKKNNVIISISDNGIGIRDDEEQSIFTKFFRSVEAKTMAPNGFGLSLFIAKKFIDAHGGDIWFEKNKDKGVTFYIALPI